MSDAFKSSYKTRLKGLQISIPHVNEILATQTKLSENLTNITLSPRKHITTSFSEVNQKLSSNIALNRTISDIGLVKQSISSIESMKSAVADPGTISLNVPNIGEIKQSSLINDSVKLTVPTIESFKQPSLSNGSIKLAITTDLGSEASSYSNKISAINNILDSTQSLTSPISEAIKVNIKTASAWNSISKTMDIKSFGAIMSKNFDYNTFNPESVSYQRNDQTSNLKSDEAIPENNDWQPGQSTSDTDVGSENLVEENIELVEYLNKTVIDMLNDGFSLPTIISVLVSWAISFTNILVKAKDAVEAYAWFAVVIVAIYKVVSKYL
ncbi:hypothetical protein C0213_03170 [Latilactobacillus sakei]|nr:hypothetical protein [Latilactobacillus sakei]AUX11447.1 hypothetical protein C0213_03170 [Latilactobacillus sakei]